MDWQWSIPTRTKEAFGLMGIVNASPDSFYTSHLPGHGSATERAIHQGNTHIQAGAALLDIGGESTRPGSRCIPVETEYARIKPVFDALSPKAPIAIDTWHAQTARRFLEQGASVINDISGAQWDPSLSDVLGSFQPGYVLTHAHAQAAAMHSPWTCTDIVTECLRYFEERLTQLTKANLPEDRIILDFGIGFGKNLAQNRALLTHINAFLAFGRPILIAIANKRLFGDLLGLDLLERSQATALATALLWQAGATWHRVHNVAESRQALLLASSLAQNQS
ncbi:MAG: dihydropteroate synthase [Desulfovibrio sp.]|nr:dihydropteroate synthase [Desulfovibrio sp.]